MFSLINEKCLFIVMEEYARISEHQEFIIIFPSAKNSRIVIHPNLPPSSQFNTSFDLQHTDVHHCLLAYLICDYTHGLRSTSLILELIFVISSDTHRNALGHHELI